MRGPGALDLSPPPPASPSACPAGGAGAAGSQGLCPAGATPPVPLRLKVRGSGSPIVPSRLRCVSSWGSRGGVHPPGLRVAPPVTVLRASRGSLPTPRRDRLSGRGGSAGKYPGGGGDGPVPQPLPARRLPVPPKKRSREGKGRMLHLRSGKRGDCEEEFLAVEVQRRTAFVGHGSAGDEVHQRC